MNFSDVKLTEIIQILSEVLKLRVFKKDPFHFHLPSVLLQQRSIQ